MVFGLYLFFALASARVNADSLLLTDQMRPFVRTLSSPTYFFNYVSRAKTGIAEDSSLTLADPGVASHLMQTLMSYWDENDNHGGDAWGLYLSDDPFSSRHLGGGADWLMFRIELPAGHRYLDIRALSEDAQADRISNEMQGKLADAGCPGQDFYKYIFRKAYDPACRRIAFTTLRELGVDSFFYPWSWVYFRHCPGASKAGVVLLSREVLRSERVQGFSPRVLPQDLRSNERAALIALQADIIRNEANVNGKPTPQDLAPFWPGLAMDPFPDIGKWEAEHLLGCAPSEMAVSFR